MNGKYRKLTLTTTVLFLMLIISTAISSILIHEQKVLIRSILTIALTILPFIISFFAHKKQITLPSTFILATIIFIFLSQYLGEIKNFYLTFWWWDLFLHFIFGSYAVIIALSIIERLIRREQDITKKRFSAFKVLFAFCFSITLGVFWESIEFLGDYFFQAHMVKGGLEDTMTDLLIKILGAFLTSLIFYYRILKK